GLNDGTVRERHEKKAGIAEIRERWSAHQREQHALSPTDRRKLGKAAARHKGKEGNSGPHETMEHDLRRREAGGNAMARRHEPDSPEQGRPRAAGKTCDSVHSPRRRAIRFHGRCNPSPEGRGWPPSIAKAAGWGLPREN